ncbi:MAG: hypothetical protein WB975_02090, partial [Nitrososphaeraceae archaeon]
AQAIRRRCQVYCGAVNHYLFSIGIMHLCEKICGIKLSERLKAVIEPKLGITFQSKETVIELNGCMIQVFVGAIGLSVSKQTR